MCATIDKPVVFDYYCIEHLFEDSSDMKDLWRCFTAPVQCMNEWIKHMAICYLSINNNNLPRLYAPHKARINKHIEWKRDSVASDINLIFRLCFCYTFHFLCSYREKSYNLFSFSFNAITFWFSQFYDKLCAVRECWGGCGWSINMTQAYHFVQTFSFASCFVPVHCIDMVRSFNFHYSVKLNNGHKKPTHT